MILTNLNFTTFVEGQEWKDSYSASTVYKQGDIVSYGGYTYIYVNTEESSGNTLQITHIGM